jgi:hypothetical protein
MFGFSLGSRGCSFVEGCRGKQLEQQVTSLLKYPGVEKQQILSVFKRRK